MTDPQTNYVETNATPSGDVQIVLLDQETIILDTALLSTSAARKLAAQLNAAADAAEDAERIARQRANLAERKRRLLAQIADLEEREAAL